MATSEEILRVKLLDAKKAESELRGVRKELERTTGSTKESGRTSHKAAKGHEHVSRAIGGLKNALGYGGGLIGIAAVGYGLKDVVQGGIKAQEQQLLLQNALRQTGQTGSHHMGQLQNAIARSSSTGGFAPVEESEALAGFVRSTKSATQAIKSNQAAIDLARGAHLSYGTAIKMVSQAETGSSRSLQRYVGIIQPVKYYVNQLSAEQKKRFPQKLKEAELLDKEATAHESARRILERYGSTVIAYNKSTAGAISNANNAFKNATEQLGLKFLPAVTAVAKGFSKLITEISKGEGPWKTVGKDITKVWEALKGVYGFLSAHKDLAKLLGYGAAVGVGAKVLSKAPGVGLATKVLKAIGPGGEAGAGAAAGEGAAAIGIGTIAGLAVPLGAALGLKEASGALGITHPNQEGFKGLEETLRKGLEGKLFEHEAKVDLHMDSVKVGEAILKNPRAARAVAEAVNKHVHTKGARS